MRILVTGGRNYGEGDSSEEGRLFQVLDDLRATVIAQGGASGADRLAALWAHKNGVPCKTYPADWPQYGRAAGPIRNKQMLDNFGPDLVVAFPGGRGTQNMISLAREVGVAVVEV